MSKIKLIFILVITLLFFSKKINSQAPSWSYNIGELIYDNCSSCHHDGGIAPFSLMTYQDAVDYKWQIHHAIDDREMPPWLADPDYRHFANETYLSDEEIALIHQWVSDGTPIGDPDEVPTPPVFLASGSLLDTVDFVVAIEPYTLQTNTDEYRWFVIETDFTESVYISKLEVFAGLESVVHHADLFLDFTGNSKAFDLQDPLPGFNGSTGTPTNSHYINAWQPGGNVAEYPDDWGIEIPPGTDLVIEIHYGPGGIGMTDSTFMNLQFVKDAPTIRPVKVGWILTDSPPVLLDGPLVIPANEVVTFHQRSAPLQNDMSLISICPHMHYLGKSYKVWAETPQGDTIRLIDIPQWDFHWQKYYTYQQIQKIPAGSTLNSVGVYDNTSANHDNPFSPPQTATSGPTTLDEMFLCYFIFADYQEGDEDIILDPNFNPTSIKELKPNLELEVFPNPTTDFIYLKGELPTAKKWELQIIDVLGKVVLQDEIEDVNALLWKGLNVAKFDRGIYFFKISNGEDVGVIRFVKE